MEKRSAEGYKKKMQYNQEYKKNNYKRIPLDVSLDKYDEIKNTAAAVGETVNGFIKKAIDERINNM